MSNELTRAQAADILGDLLQTEETSWKTTDLFDQPRERMPAPRPRWVAQGITLVYVQHTCAHCGATHSHTSPKILLNEALLASDGTVMKTHQTVNPKMGILGNNVHGDLKDRLNIEYLEGEATDFCIECIEQFSELELAQLFIRQQARMESKSTGLRLERMAAIERATNKLKGDKKVDKQAELLEDLLTASVVEGEEDE